MQTIKLKVKGLAKKFFEYRIEDDIRIYQLKHTGIALKKSLTKQTFREYGGCAIEPEKIIFDNYMGRGYGCNSKYVTEELLKSGRNFDIVWTVKEIEKHKDEFPEGVRLVEYGSKEAMREYYTAGVWVLNYHLIAYFNKGLVKRENQSYIQLWHGSFGIKRIENDCDCLTQSSSWTYLARKNAQNTDYWISNSTFESGVYRRAFWSVEQVLEFGHPRNDLFFREDLAVVEDKVRKSLGISRGERIALYVPTFRENLQFPEQKLDACGLKRVLEERTKESWRIVVRLHPRMQGALETVCTHVDGQVVRADGYPDIQELLAASQIVVTDYSSCIFDFMLTRRPGLLFAPDIKDYNQERGFYYPLEETPFPLTESNEELFAAVRNFNRREYEERVEQFLAEKGSKEDGHAAERVCALIEKIIKEKES